MIDAADLALLERERWALVARLEALGALWSDAKWDAARDLLPVLGEAWARSYSMTAANLRVLLAELVGAFRRLTHADRDLSHAIAAEPHAAWIEHSERVIDAALRVERNANALGRIVLSDEATLVAGFQAAGEAQALATPPFNAAMTRLLSIRRCLQEAERHGRHGRRRARSLLDLPRGG